MESNDTANKSELLAELAAPTPAAQAFRTLEYAEHVEKTGMLPRFNYEEAPTPAAPQVREGDYTAMADGVSGAILSVDRMSAVSIRSEWGDFLVRVGDDAPLYYALAAIIESIAHPPAESREVSDDE